MPLPHNYGERRNHINNLLATGGVDAVIRFIDEVGQSPDKGDIYHALVRQSWSINAVDARIWKHIAETITPELVHEIDGGFTYDSAYAMIEHSPDPEVINAMYDIFITHRVSLDAFVYHVVQNQHARRNPQLFQKTLERLVEQMLGGGATITGALRPLLDAGLINMRQNPVLTRHAAKSLQGIVQFLKGPQRT